MCSKCSLANDTFLKFVTSLTVVSDLWAVCANNIITTREHGMPKPLVVDSKQRIRNGRSNSVFQESCGDVVWQCGRVKYDNDVFGRDDLTIMANNYSPHSTRMLWTSSDRISSSQTLNRTGSDMTPRQKLRELYADTVIGMSPRVVHLTIFWACLPSVILISKSPDRNCFTDRTFPTSKVIALSKKEWKCCDEPTCL